MGAQSGKDVLIKLDMTGDGVFQVLAGLKATRLTFNAATVEVTSLESAGWRELLAGAGVRSATISGSGIFKDDSTFERARAVFFAADTPQFQVIIPAFGTVQGAFQITALEYAGTFDAEATYQMTFASAAALVFTPVP